MATLLQFLTPNVFMSCSTPSFHRKSFTVVNSRVNGYSYSGKSKGKIFYVHARKAYRGRKGIAPLIFKLGSRWMPVVNFGRFIPWGERMRVLIE
jgi:hypothetical protein